HIESSLLTPLNYSKAVIRYGTTAVFADPHEIANVLGMEGFKLFFEEAKISPIRIFLEIPSSIPIEKELSTTRSRIDVEQIKELLEYSNIIGEVMDYNGLLSCDNNIINKIVVALKHDAIIDGHAPMLNLQDLCSYVSAGITSCHENDYPQDLLNKLRLGMYAMIREGSLSRNTELISKITLNDKRRLLLASDDLLPTDMIKRGHINYNIRRVIEEGIEPLEAIQMATLNIAERFGLSLHLGSVAPAKLADMIVLDDLKEFKPSMVFIDGRLLVKDDRVLFDQKFIYPDHVKNTVNVKRKIRKDDLKLDIDKDAFINVIEVTDSLITNHLIQEINDMQGLEKVVVIERHKASGNMAVGFVKGFGLESGAIASSISHDSHNIIGVGVRDEDLVLAINTVIDMQGGFTVTKNKKILAKLELPIAGLISEKEADTIAKELSYMLDIIKEELNCKHNSPLIALTFLALPVIPHLRITDKGLINVDQHKIIQLQKK
ncbi:MAG: adenine deaminase, partial [Candidatus Nitrosothermus koennekii]